MDLWQNQGVMNFVKNARFITVETGFYVCAKQGDDARQAEEMMDIL